MAQHTHVRVVVDTGDSFFKSLYTYQVTTKVPPIGGRVLVPFGPQDTPTVGLVLEYTSAEQFLELKTILEVIDEEPLLSPILLELLIWASAYALSSFFQAVRFAVPHPLYGQGTVMVKLLLTEEQVREALMVLRKKNAFLQADILEYLINLPQTTTNHLKRKFKSQASAVLKALSKKGFVALYPLEYRKRKAYFSRAFLYYYQHLLSPAPEPLPNPHSQLAKRIIQENNQKELTTDRLFLQEVPLAKISLPQNETEYQILKGPPQDREPFILEKIKQAIKQGGQVLLITSRLYHSHHWQEKLFRATGRKPLLWSEYKNLEQKLQDWEDIRWGLKKIVIGSKRSLFLPYKNLQLIIVDELAIGSYKTSGLLRVDIKDCLDFIQERRLASVIIGSSVKTPYLSYLQKQNRYEYQQTSSPSAGLPFIIPARDKGSYYPQETLSAIGEVLNNGGTVLYFQNRRGFYTVYLCPKCKYQDKCPNCQINLVYHLKTGRLHCHTCDFSSPLRENCPHCQQKTMTLLGVGTQRVVEEMNNLFQKPTLRIDADTLKLGSRQAIVSTLQKNKPLLIVATEAIFSFFYDFYPDLCVYGNPDLNLSLPDYQGEETVYKTCELLQVMSGRPVHLLTYQEASKIEKMALNWSANLLSKYQEFSYPPFSQMVRLTLSGSHKEEVSQQARVIREWVNTEFGKNLDYYLFSLKREGKYINNLIIRGKIGLAERLRLFDILKTKRQQVKIIPDPAGLIY